MKTSTFQTKPIRREFLIAELKKSMKMSNGINKVELKKEATEIKSNRLLALTIFFIACIVLLLFLLFEQ